MIVLRGLAFYAHAFGTAAFPGLVVADGLAISATVGAFATAGLVAGLVAVVARRQRENYATATALILVAALAAGVILAPVGRLLGSVRVAGCDSREWPR